jgi:Fe-S-cluster containining protein
MNLSHAKELYDRVSSRIPEFECKKKCQEACGPVFWSEAEQLVIVDWLQQRGQEELLATNMDSLTCPYLKEGLCSIHEVRPILCQLYGATKDERMHCPFGCRPKKRIKEKPVRRIFERLLKVSDDLYGPFRKVMDSEKHLRY